MFYPRTHAHIVEKEIGLRTTDSRYLLEVKKLTKKFGGLSAINEVNLGVRPGEIHGLIGPNGAGKTTFFNLTSGVLKPTRGEITFDGMNITQLKPHKIAKRGLIRTFQANILFLDYSVLENVLLGCHLQTGIGFFQDLFNFPATREKRRHIRERALDLLNFTGLEGFESELAKNLPHGYQRALGTCIALAAEPKLLMLDEPVTGMNTEEKQAMMNLILGIRDRGITVLVVEHDMKVVMGLCDRISVINFGEKIADGVPEEIRNNPNVIEAYLGADQDESSGS